MGWLERSIETGFPCWTFFKIDPHLHNLQQEPQFQDLIASLQRKYTALQIKRV